MAFGVGWVGFGSVPAGVNSMRPVDVWRWAVRRWGFLMALVGVERWV
jgi:hypothetical protein